MATEDNGRSMRPIPPFLLALLMSANSAGAQPSAEPVVQVPLHVFVEAMAGWVATALERPLPDAMPEIAFVGAAQMAQVRRDQQAVGGDSGKDILAFYNLETSTIFLPRGWIGSDAVQVSILVHELVHHFQSASGEGFACPAERERDAFDVQELWLSRFDETLEGAIGINPLARLVLTRCMF